MDPFFKETFFHRGDFIMGINKGILLEDDIHSYDFTIGNIYGTVKKIPYKDFMCEFSILEEMAMIYVNKLRQEGQPVSEEIWKKMNRAVEGP